MSVNAVTNTSSASTSLNCWEDIKTTIGLGFTRHCHYYCFKDLPDSCKKVFNPEGYKSPDQKCMEAWRTCMKLCVYDHLMSDVLER